MPLLILAEGLIERHIAGVMERRLSAPHTQ
jgi:hypothetical protein